jgi:ketosteroid isomerase-like protein
MSIIEDIRTGWETADGTPFEKHYLDFEGARYIESGGQNKGLDDLIHHHVEPEGDVLDGLSLTFSDVETHFEGDFAWAIADVVVRATYKADGRKIHRKGFETFLFRYVDNSWRVVHTHSSTREVKE